MKRILCGISALLMCAAMAGCPAPDDEIQTVTCLAEPEPRVIETDQPAESELSIGTEPKQTSAPDYTVEEISGYFTPALLKEIVSEEENTVISPLSVKLALNMAALGAKGNTERELLTLFGYENSEQMRENSRSVVSELGREDGSITVSNSVWITDSYDAGENYIAETEDIFGAELFRQRLSDGGIVGALNGWIDEKTNGLIPNMISEPFGADTVMLLVNALYFKNEWVYEFTSWEDFEMTFHGAKGDCTTKCMSLEERGISYAEGDIFRSVGLSYRDGSYMNLYLPAEDTESVLDIIERLSPAELSAAMDMTYEENFVNIFMPKFECSYNESLKETLQRLGLSDPFEPNAADLGGILDTDTYDALYISDVVHAAKIECNEKGTEAAAATIAACDAEAMPAELPIRFTADRPFIYEIKSPSGEVLFIGVISGF